MTAVPPIALFAYRRPDFLARTLDSLRANEVPHIIAFSDGARDASAATDVAEVRSMLRSVTWTRLELIERPVNLGLGRSIITGVTEVLRSHDSVLVCEDDLVSLPGTVRWLAAAMTRYRDDERVLSVSGWSHARITPAGIGEAPFFSARVTSYFWGTWARAWRGMDQGSASSRLEAYAASGGDPAHYGADIPLYAAVESTRNLWAVRFIAEHLARGGLTVNPPWTMVKHIGYDIRASNAVHDPTWYEELPARAPAIPREWPRVIEHPDIARLWREAVEVELSAGRPPTLVVRVLRRLSRMFGGSA